MLAARETKMLSAERMERMIDAPTNDEAAKILEECGYGDLSGLSAKEAGAALEAHIAALFDEVEGMVPEAQLVQLFRLKYDYHNAKALIKARAMGVECDAILSQRGTVAPQKLLTAFLEEDYRDIPPILAQAMVSAAAILARTTNPQAADFELDRAYFAQMLALSDGLSDGGLAVPDGTSPEAAKERTFRFLDALQVIDISNNLGDAKSLAIHNATTTHSQLTESELVDAGVAPEGVRLSIGIENVDDLIADLDKALSA